ncbi:MAG: DEAD/DEAH box helicase [Planctomycetia bacterium]
METEHQATFEEMPLGPTILQTLKKLGYHHPTPIQAALIPKAIEGLDIMGQAQTGTGKTASFVLPIFQMLTEQRQKPQALILAPTRELVMQVREEANRLVEGLGWRVEAAYGGEHLQRQMRTLAQGVEVVVGTPGRLLDLCRRNALKIDAVSHLVMDEADRMLDIGFRPDIERILRQTPASRQTLLLSATMPAPVLRLAQRYMRNPITINLSPDQISVEHIVQKYLNLNESQKFAALMYLLVREKPRQAIIFCQTKWQVRELAGQLGRRIRGVTAMQGDLPQSARNRVMQGFRDGSIRVLVATDVVGRGIDVQGISHVFNFDIPEDPEQYVHRVGRTGRMGKDGIAFTLVTPDQGRLLTNVEIYINRQLQRETLPGDDSSPSSDTDSHRAAAPTNGAAPGVDDEPPKPAPAKEIPSRYRRAL